MQNTTKISSGKSCLLLFLIVCFLLSFAACSTAFAPEPGLTPERLAPIEKVVDQAIRDGNTPGAVLLIGYNSKVVYHRAFGNRSLNPQPVPMTVDTIFDLASLTKVVATTTAIMQLVEKKKIALNDPVMTYWPSFEKNGKSRITIRQLLTHYSGLRPDLSERPPWSGYGAALARIIEEWPEAPPGSSYIYSDINFEVLGEIVHRVSGLSIDRYCASYIFSPLGIRDTGFRPPPKQLPRIAPADSRDGQPVCGVVQDPTCALMGGVCGHAGLFSTAADLARFAEMLLNGGELNGVCILQPETVEIMTRPQSPPPGASAVARLGLGSGGWRRRDVQADIGCRIVWSPGIYRDRFMDRTSGQDLCYSPYQPASCQGRREREGLARVR